MEQPVVQEEDRLEQLIAYYDIAVHMSAREAKQEYLMQRNLMSSGTCSDQHLLTAMLLMNPALNVSGKELAPAFLQPCIEYSGEQDLKVTHLARILWVQLAEKRKQRAVKRKLVAARYKINLLNERVSILNQKLDELKNIERSIRER